MKRSKTDFRARFQGFSVPDGAVQGGASEGAHGAQLGADVQIEFPSKLDATVRGKTAVQITAQRDSLIAEARTHFAKDPKTRDAVIALLSSEMSSARRW